MRMMLVPFFYLAVCFISAEALYPRDSETRESKNLDGVWDFVLTSPSDGEEGFRNEWYTHSLSEVVNRTVHRMPVPSSFNDVTQDPEIRDFVGWVWYQRNFFVSKSWDSTEKKIHLRFDSVHYSAIVYLNGKLVLNHTGGHLPFETDVTSWLRFDQENTITVAVDNTLTAITVPQGLLVTSPDRPGFNGSYRHLKPFFDFFNYAGIHRSVRLYVVPVVHITDITIVTSIDDNGKGIVEYTVEHDRSGDALDCEIEIQARDGKVAKTGSGCAGALTIDNPKLWWPLGMSDAPGYLYIGKFILKKGQTVVDVYYEKIGIRSVAVANQTLLINKQPFYFRGFGKHEDSPIRGRGFDLPQIVKDVNLIKWIGANSYRTSHYPYSEEQMDMADETGIVVIDECPAVGLQYFSEPLFEQHFASLRELIARDKNRPSVVMWSIANEPQTQHNEVAMNYFKKMTGLVRKLDTTRPITAALSEPLQNDVVAQFLDVLMLNRYYGWYSDTGAIPVVKDQLVYEVREWNRVHANKPILISEYGADTVPGIHSSPSYVFSEEYQAEILTQYFAAFDLLRDSGLLIGEMIWNFADFMTDQSITRVLGNRKGIFTRDRQPKTAAHILRCRYLFSSDHKIEETAGQVFFCPKRIL